MHLVSLGSFADRVFLRVSLGQRDPEQHLVLIRQQMEGKVDSNCHTSPHCLDSTFSSNSSTSSTLPLFHSYPHSQMDTSGRTTHRHCPHCKTLRTATKRLSLSRLPPVLLIHLKRFSAKGPFTDKVETFVEFPLRGLDLTNDMPPPLPPGADKGRIVVAPDDPRSQIPPYRYNLYGVTNHTGNLSSGHCAWTFFFSGVC